MSDFPQDAFVSHISPGRLRVKIPSKKGDEAFFSGIKTRLSGIPGVEQVSINSMTGSVLVLHSIDEKTVSELIQANRITNPQTLGSRSSTFQFHPEVTKTFDSVNHRVKDFIGGGVNVGALAFLALLGAGSYQIAKGNFAAIPWYTAFWYALNIFLKSKPNGNRDGE